MILLGTTVHAFGRKQWVINAPDKSKFLVNENAQRLFLILQKWQEPSDALNEYNEVFDKKLSLEQFLNLIVEAFGRYNVLDYEGIEEKLGLENRYLRAKLTLISSKWASWVSKPLQFFYKSSIFWWAFGSCIMVILMALFTIKTDNIFQLVNFPTYFILIYGAMFFHELGHIAASEKYKIEHFGIDFRFYFLMPIFSSHVSNTRLLDTNHRIIIETAGVFNELLYASILSIIYLINGDFTLLAAALSIFTLVIWKFNPFVRLDGYWILAILTNTTNLLKKGNSVFLQIISASSIKKPIWTILKAKPDVFCLFMYGLFNLLFWAVLGGYTLYFLWDIVVSFPFLVWLLVQKIFDFSIDFSDVNRQLVLVSIFYVLILRIVYNYFAEFLNNFKPNIGKPIRLLKHEKHIL